MEILKHPKILRREDTALLLIDIQEKILPVIFENERVVENALKLIMGFNVMRLPVYFTEQYPKGLGNTNAELLKELNGSAILKMSFSCSGAGDLFEELIKNDIKQVVVCGIESHVCVQQTVLDLLSNGFQVNVAADAVSSRKKFDYETALNRMNKNGAEITTTESVLFELLNICGTEEFKSVSKIIK
ncbi:MAG: hydrolase [Ignavibacteriae bacterium HGW-Ignavibacteriae-2]|jgi:nicotinamidase-related amidase|nr:MAG: hydrolase [Ignavibacteriae bacterium HGW-Ignavibacteriae-2]